MLEDRRQYMRLTPKSPLIVSLDDCKSGLLLDVGEGGLAVASLLPRNLDETISLAFDLPEGTGHIEAKAEIAWIRDSGHLTGVRFVVLDEACRSKLSEWIGARANLLPPVREEEAEPVFVTRSTYAQVDAVAHEDRDKPAGVTTSLATAAATAEAAVAEVKDTTTILSETGLSGSAKSRHTIELILAVVLLTWALVYLGYQMGSTNTGMNRQTPGQSAAPSERAEASAAAIENNAGSRALVASVEASVAPTAAAPARAAASGLTLSDSGVVLQVGAMRLEDNADAMAQELQKKNFPAFVFRHGGDRLYRVAIGPFGSVEETVKIKAELERQGLQPLLRSWIPQ
jgi:cell division septation protein DedD